MEKQFSACLFHAVFVKEMEKMERANLWNEYSKTQLKELELFAKDYRDFLDAGKTERECVESIINLIEQEGYV